jgi:hypothetical protein
MGSLARRYAPLIVLAGCTSGAPTGFSAGDRWTVPLVGPLENGSLIVPATVDGKGPYLFAIDPDANVSSVDEDVVREAKLQAGQEEGGSHVLDENAAERPAFYAEVLQWQLGTLTVDKKPAFIAKAHTYDRDGRRIHGVIGHDIIADSLVFQFDRDQGLVTLSTTKAFSPPAGATPVKYETLYSKIENTDAAVPMPRRLVKASIDGKHSTMHVALGEVASSLRPVTAGDVTKASVTLGPVTASAAPFTAYHDRRWDDQYIDGDLGLSVFAHHDVAVSWDGETVYLWPRADQPLATRLGRWQSKTLSSCEHPGCATISMIDPMAGKELTGPHPGLVVTVARDASSSQVPLEVVFAVTGKPGLSWLVASLPAGVDRAMTHVPADYIGATATVIDASPFPRTCPTEGGCIDKLAPP